MPEISQAVLDDIYSRLNDLQMKIERLQNNPAPTIPIMDSAHFPLDAIEGQVVIATT